MFSCSWLYDISVTLCPLSFDLFYDIYDDVCYDVGDHLNMRDVAHRNGIRHIFVVCNFWEPIVQ